MEILCFFAGTALIFIKSVYPLVFLLIVLFFRPRLVFVGWFLAAITWGLLHQWWGYDQGMPHDEIINKALIEGRIASIPTVSPGKTQFQFSVERLNNKSVKATLLLSCYQHCPELHAGQYWQLMAKLKKPHNLANPGGFDYVSWLNTRHIAWTGYSRNGTFKPVTTKNNQHTLLALREHLAMLLAQIDPDEKTLGILQALTLGVTTHIDKEEWELFRRTGTIHLMVISGAHIGLVAGLTYALTKWLWCRMGRICLRYPAPKAASIAALFLALIYALLAGFAVPAQRALIVCFFMFIRNFCSQRFSVWQAWRYALFGVLLFEPHSVLMSGFYLSFIAVAILILINQRIPWRGIRKTIALQLACLFGLMPLTLFWFSYGAVNGLVANLVAIPWVSFIIVPMALFTTLLAEWLVLPWLVVALKGAIACLLYYLSWIDSFALFNLQFTYKQILSPLALMAAMSIVIFLPSSRFLPAATVLTIAALFPAFEKVKQGEAHIDVLDVGQGLAVIVRTENHILAYDTGVKFYQGSDMGKIVMIPYLSTLGVQKLDKVVISHPDLDHRGGLLSLQQKFNIGELIVDDPKFYRRGTSCHQYPTWTWDGVSFRFFAIAKELGSKNNSSCILQVSTKSGQVLLTGDIEKQGEQYLVETYGNALASTVMLVPHHGSKTSSSTPFLQHISPRYAISSYGFDNRYHFPHQQTMRGYAQLQIAVYNTMDCGMVRVTLTPRDMEKPTCFRSAGFVD